MESRLQQMSLNSSPTALLSESPSRLRSSTTTRIVSNPQSLVNQTQPSSYNPSMISSAQRGMPYNMSQKSNVPSRVTANERTYINVNPVAYVSRQGITVNPSPTQIPELTQRSQSAAAKQPQVPAIPRSQLVKQFVEPSYSTILQPERDAITLRNEQNKVAPISLTKSSIANQSNTNVKTATPPPPLLQQHPVHLSSGIVQNQGMGSSEVDSAIYANTYAFNSNLSVASNYSELEALRSSDSQGSTEEELNSLNQNQLYSGISSTDRLSPVSSSYSELRQATRPRPPQATPVAATTSYPFQGNQNQYDTSLYEPITPAVRARTVSVGAALASPAPNEQINFNTLNSRNTVIGKIGYGSSNSSRSFNDGLPNDYFGLCSKCFNKIIGEGTGCTAMGRLYHIECFRCTSCECQLQGKPFYALDGKPFCEADYMQTLEKCCKCNQAIMDRILRATGKPYHPQCFTCVMCNKSLDGVPFTVDAKNQIHCIEDFHKRFAPRCSVCHQPIMPKSNNEETVRVVALDRSFHVECYKCEDCGLRLTSEADGKGCYPLDDHVLCKQCNTQRIQLLTQGIE